MATTTNYGWTTPDDTALVKDGAAAIRTLGSSVDTTTKNLNPETTLGDISFRSSTSNVNTRLGIGTSGQFLSVVAGVPAWAALTDQTPLTTKGDLFTFSTLDARLGVGANGTLLTADSAEATGLKWAAATAAGANFTLLNSGGTSLTGTSTSITGISGQDKLMIELRNVSHNAATNYSLNVQFNTDTGNNYRFNGFQYTGASSYAASNLGKFNLTTSGIDLFTSSSAANNDGAGYVLITGCNSSGVKVFTASGSSTAGSGADAIGRSGGGVYNSASTISSVQIKISGGTFDDGQVFIYGSA